MAALFLKPIARSLNLCPQPCQVDDIAYADPGCMVKQLALVI